MHTYHVLTGAGPQYVHALHERYGKQKSILQLNSGAEMNSHSYIAGPVVRIGPDKIDFASVDALQTIYGTKETFRKSKWYMDLVGAKDPTKDASAFSTTDVETHRRQRRFLGGPMSESSLKALIPLVNSRVELVIRRMKGEMTTRGAADVAKWWFFMATDIIGELTFGDSFRMVELGRVSQTVISRSDLNHFNQSVYRKMSMPNKCRPLAPLVR
jgi:cytochrome P450